MHSYPVSLSFSHYFSHLDLAGVASLLDDDIRYDGGKISKSSYLREMERVFAALKAENIRTLKVSENACTGCNRSMKGFVFIDEANEEYYSFILEIKNNKIMDLIECSRFSCATPLENYRRVVIDPYTGFEGEELPF
jgi:hypothetical protein